MVANALWSRSLYCDGDTPTMLRNVELNEPSDTHPTAKQTSVTVAPCRSIIMARSIRRVIKYVYGVSPYTARNRREKCAGDIAARSANAGTLSRSR